ncbi:extracellular solute-binding protein [Microlunatus elymi]|uniref:Extracellular solute-binding protein n=1 Tax=Microlunatus elymi TaxID=2596828 RepID=A0A516PXK3_9ACTN|nr:extracellular solute-binding protein [Microlunatus elymi]QDP95905.1 extracellular solute-binding protein [Microlunatus elymi]
MSAFHATPRLSRRTVLAGVGATALLGGALTGCSDSTDKKNTATANETVKLPTYTPATIAKPDFPGTEQGVEPAYKLFPSDHNKSVADKPGTGKDTVTGMVITYAALPPGVGRNPYWQGLNERLGIDLKLQMTPSADYVQKFSTTIAGNDLPDMMLTQVVANFPSLLDKRFSPLDEYLGGDAVKDYPNLANIPTDIWKSVIYNGKIYGLPLPRGLVGSYNFIRADLFKKAGVSTAPKSFDELMDASKALTNPKKRRWGYDMIGHVQALIGRMNEEPNSWAVDSNGKFTHRYETDAYQRSVSDVIQMWKAGVLHPDAFNPQQPFKDLFAAGTVAINASDGYTGFNGYWTNGLEGDPNFELGLMPAYKRDGGGLAPWALGSGSFGMASIKKMDADRIKLCLRMADYFAAPFGSEEYYYLSYGKEGVDHTVDKNGNPTLTDTGKTNLTLPMRYLGDSTKVSYSPGRPQDAKTQHDYQSLEVPHGVQNAALGLFSNAQATKNATADKAFNDTVNDIIQGRKPYSELKNAISTWQNAVGNEMRTEYQDQYKKANGSK